MVMISVTVLAGTMAHAVTGLHRFVAAVVAFIAREQRRRRATAFLIGQSDHLLRDLGLARGDVAREVRVGRR